MFFDFACGVTTVLFREMVLACFCNPGDTVILFAESLEKENQNDYIPLWVPDTTEICMTALMTEGSLYML